VLEAGARVRQPIPERAYTKAHKQTVAKRQEQRAPPPPLIRNRIYTKKYTKNARKNIGGGGVALQPQKQTEKAGSSLFVQAEKEKKIRHGIGPPDAARKLYWVSNSRLAMTVKLLCKYKRKIRNCILPLYLQSIFTVMSSLWLLTQYNIRAASGGSMPCLEWPSFFF
jgi:hypothetical protein